jgi:hypothetical protein
MSQVIGQHKWGGTSGSLEAGIGVVAPGGGRRVDAQTGVYCGRAGPAVVVVVD